jgi:cysteine desulfurase/selenocysteine lyase
MNATEITPSSAAISFDWSEFRRQMPVARKWAYLDHACVAPIPQPAFEAMNKYATELLLEGDTVWLDWERQHEALRRLTAQTINSAPEEIALVPNTTFGINLVADGFPWTAGDNVVLPAHEFPSNLYPWMALEERGVEMRVVELDGQRVCANRIAEACDSRTRIVSASWIGYGSGYRLDPAEIAKVAHDHDALFFLDAIQGLGVFPLDVAATQVDFLAADGHKWQLGPEGAGLAYIRREHLNKLRPHGVGWHSVVHASDFSHIELKLKESAARFEGGSHNMAGFIAWGASLDLLIQLGIENIAAAIIDFTDQACAALQQVGAKILSPRDPEKKSGIVTFDLPGRDAMSLRKQCLDQGVVLSCRGGHLRISPHAYNNEEDLQRLLAALE